MSLASPWMLLCLAVVPALVAGQASLGVMVAVMTLTGSVVVDHFHQEQHDVFPIIAAHFVGLYALVIIVGDLVDRVGRTQALAGGLIVMGLSVSGLLWVEGAHATAGALFGLGLGWNVSFVAATCSTTCRKPSDGRTSTLIASSPSDPGTGVVAAGRPSTAASTGPLWPPLSPCGDTPRRGCPPGR